MALSPTLGTLGIAGKGGEPCSTIEKLAGKATETGPDYNEDIGNDSEEGRGIILAAGRHHYIKDQSASLW